MAMQLGTAADSPERLASGVCYMLSSNAQQNGHVCLPREKLIAAAAKLLGAEEARVDEVLSAFQTYYVARCDILTRPYPGVPELLACLDGKYPLAVVSNKPDRAVKELANIYFPTLYARGESADCPRKPAPDMVHMAMQALDAENCVYVGDSEVDVLTAKNAHVPCLSVTWGFRDEQVLRETGAEYFCHRAEDVPKCIEEILKRELENGK
jgi:phosphoglycolate phosphatase